MIPLKDNLFKLIRVVVVLHINKEDVDFMFILLLKIIMSIRKFDDFI